MSLFDAKLTERRRWIQVGDVYEITKKPRVFDLSPWKAIPFVPMAAIPQGGNYAPDFTLRTPAQIRSGTYFARGDILVAKITPSFENGKQALAAEIPIPFGFATTEVIPLRPRHKGHDRRLLFFYLLHPDIRHYVAERMEGSTGRQRVPPEVLLDLPFPEFALEEQRAISDTLEVIQDFIALEAEAAEVTTSLKRATMQQLFTSGLNNEAHKETEIGPMPESWEAESIADLTNVVYRYPSYYKIDYVDCGVPEVRGELLKDGGEIEGDLSLFRFIDDETAARFPKVRLETGDIVMSVRGTMGKIGIARNIHRGAVITANLIRLAPDRQKISPEFFKFVLTSERFSRALDMASPQTTIKTITSPVLKSLRLPTPPTPDEQNKIVAILDAIDRKIDLHRRKRAVLDDLFKALLHNLMTGEIRVEGIDLSALHCDVEKATELFNKSPLLRC